MDELTSLLIDSPHERKIFTNRTDFSCKGGWLPMQRRPATSGLSRWGTSVRWIFSLFFLLLCTLPAGAGDPLDNLPVEALTLRVISPTVLEARLITATKSGNKVREWDLAGPGAEIGMPWPNDFEVSVNGQRYPVTRVGFKRRVLYATLKGDDKRVGNHLYLKLLRPVPSDQTVEVRNRSGLLWPAEKKLQATADPYRLSPAIHLNQVGYAPDWPKQALVGYYLGSMGELPLSSGAPFKVIAAKTKQVIFSGRLERKLETGWIRPTYLNVFAADFSSLSDPGEYFLQVPGLGLSYPFRVDEGIAAALTRTYGLGLYHQRCGAANRLPFTRFTHGPCHLAPASIPTLNFQKVQEHLQGMLPPHSKNKSLRPPPLVNTAASLFPFIRHGQVDVSGGHHDAGDYSKYTINSAQMVHALIFAVDAFPEVAALDNVGLPESGDGIPDLLQVAKWEADFLAKMQDQDGGFSFLVYPRDRRYESDVLPDQGDPQVVFPKNTAATAAAVAALAQTASSRAFKNHYPKVAASYLKKAKRGWDFLESAWLKHGREGAYQPISHYGHTFADKDEIAWAATEMFLATGEKRYHQQLLAEFDPSAVAARKWHWWRLFEGYGSAVRSYAFAGRTGRIAESKLDPEHLQRCSGEIVAAGWQLSEYARGSAYGTSFPFESKRHQRAAWYFPLEWAFDLAAAYQLEPRPEFFEAIISNINFQAGANPNNLVFINGLGNKRPRQIVHQYALNDRRLLPPSGLPVGSIQDGFGRVPRFGGEFAILSYPPDDMSKEDHYPMYDRWADVYHLGTEATTAGQARSLATLAWLMGRTPLKNQTWTGAKGKIGGVPTEVKAGQQVTADLKVEGLDPGGAIIVWEASGQEPRVAGRYSFTIDRAGSQWIEAEALWPDGRRVFAVHEFLVRP